MLARAGKAVFRGSFSGRVGFVPRDLFLRTLFVAVEPTPNPDSLKFVPDGRRVLEEDQGAGFHFHSIVQAKDAPLVKEILRLPGVTGVFLGPNFVSVNKLEDASWEDLRPLLLGMIMDSLESSEPVLRSVEGVEGGEGEVGGAEDDDEVVLVIKELLDTRIRPAVQEDGGDIHFRGWDEATGIVKLQMAGSCVGCPSSSATLRNGVENMLMHYIPEVSAIEEVVDEEEEAATAQAQVTLEEKLRAAGVE